MEFISQLVLPIFWIEYKRVLRSAQMTFRQLNKSILESMAMAMVQKNWNMLNTSYNGAIEMTTLPYIDAVISQSSLPSLHTSM